MTSHIEVTVIRELSFGKSQSAMMVKHLLPYQFYRFENYEKGFDNKDACKASGMDGDTFVLRESYEEIKQLLFQAQENAG